MKRCPPREQLRRLLAEELTGSELIALQKHVDGCPGCQERLEILSWTAGELSPLPESGTKTGECRDVDPAGEVLAPRQEFLDRLMAQGPPVVAGSPVVAGPGEAATTGGSEDPATTGGRGAPEAGWPALPGYEILGVLGQGGMGQVYRARDLRLNRLVALKVIGIHATPEQRARFQREAEAAARLQHPHIVQVYEVGEQDGQPYLTLELVEGGSLAQQLQGTPQPARAAAELVRILAQAIHYAHQQGIIHRDLKPANILLASVVRSPSSVAKEIGSSISNYGLPTTDYGLFPKITDFGLAKLLDRDRIQTQSGLIVGTPAYMAPEQAAGSGRAIGPAADIYALGVILYEMLTGRRPFQGETPLETLQQVVSAEPVSPSRLRPKLPRDLQTICLKCLEKEPYQRYQSAAALAEDLRRFLAGEPIQARSVSRRERLWRWCRRNPKLALLTAAVALLLVVVVGGSSLAAFWLRAERNRAVRAEQDAIDKLQQSYLTQARAGRSSGLAGQGCRGLELIKDIIALKRTDSLTSDQILALRNEAIACLAMPDVRELRLPGVPPSISFIALAIDPALERCAIVERSGDVVLRRLDDEKAIRRFPAPLALPSRSEPRVRFSPDGRFVQVQYAREGANDASCFIWDSQTGHKVLQREILGCDFHPQRPVFAARTTDGKIRLYELPRGREIRCLDLGDLALVGVRFDPSGRRLACMGRGTVRILNVDSAKLEAEFSQGRIDGEPLDWSPDGRWLAVPADRPRIQIYDTVQPRLLSTLEGHEATLTRVAFSPVGNLLASYGTDGRTRLWDPLSGKQLVSVSGEFLRFSRDGRRLAFREVSHFGIWEVAAETVCRTLHDGPLGNRMPNQQDGPLGGDFSRDGRILASPSRDGVRLWDTATFGEAAHLAIGPTQSVLFDPRGGGFVTHGLAGVRYWPVEQLPDPAGSWRVGPPRILHPTGTWQSDARLAWDGQGHFLAFTEAPRHRVQVLPMTISEKGDSPSLLKGTVPSFGQPIILTDPDRGGRIYQVALSPDGKWAASTARKDPRVKIWEVATGKGRYLPGLGPRDAAAGVAFSPDGRWLVAASLRGYHWWRVDSWEPGPAVREEHPLPCWPSLGFARNGSVLAIVRAQHNVQLVDPASGRELATLIAPDRHMISWLAFNLDGTQLAATTPDHLVQLWDLRRLRSELNKLGLDWDLPRFAPRTEAGVLEPMRITVVEGTHGQGGVTNRGQIEAEDLPVVAAVDCECMRQPMNGWNAAQWSNGQQLFCSAGKGGSVELDIVADGAPKDRYRLDICFTKAPDYGMVEVALDGKKLGGIFDGFAEEVAPSGRIPFGEVELRQGHHRLRFTIIDKNPRSRNYFMGIDCLDLSPIP
jgi:serine/threonine protein kinase/WD40 repeat protein